MQSIAAKYMIAMLCYGNNKRMNYEYDELDKYGI